VAIEKAAATANYTLDTTSPTLITGLTLSPAAGNYFLYCTVVQDTPGTAGSNQGNRYQVYVGGSLIAHSERLHDEDTSVDDDTTTYVISCMVSPTAGQAVEIRYDANSSSTPQIAMNREMNLFPIASGEVEVTATGTSTTSSGTFADLLTAITPAAGTYMVVFSSSFEASAAVEIGLRIAIEGVVVAGTKRLEEQESSSSSDFVSVHVAGVVTVDGTEDVDLQWNSEQGGTVTIQDRTLVLIPTAIGDVFSATGTADDSDSTATNKQLDDMLIENPGDADYLCIFTNSDWYGSIANNTAETVYSIRINAGSWLEVSDSPRMNEHEGSLDSVNMMAACGGRITVVGASDDIAIWWQNDTTDARISRDRTMILLREPSGGQDFPEDLIPGSYALTGLPIEKDIDLNQQAGSYALSGFSMEPGVELGLVPGAYVLTGLEIEKDLDLSVLPGAYALTGIQIADIADYLDDMTPGAYVLSGLAILIDISLNQQAGAYVITGLGMEPELGFPILPGSYALTGFEADLPKSVIQDQDPGAYALTGFSMLPQVDLNLAPGAYSLTGLEILSELGFSVLPGSYVLTGIEMDPVVLADLVEDLTPGVYLLTGASLGIDTAMGMVPGAYALTGFEISKDVALDMLAGVYVLTGFETQLLSDYIEDLALGSYIITGASLSTDLGLSLVPGAYILNGLALAFDAALNAASGAYALTGFELDTQVAILLDLTPGAYALTGFEAQLVAAILEDMTPGAYTLTGFSMSKDIGLNLVAGAYSLTGLPLAFDTSLDLAAGIYLLSGLEASLVADEAFDMDPGVYSLVGQVLSFDLGLALAPGAYSLTGFQAQLVKDFILNLASGAYNLTGFSSLSVAQYIQELAPGAYTLTGVEILDQPDYGILAAPGIYSITGFGADVIQAQVFNLALSIVQPLDIGGSLRDQPFAIMGSMGYPINIDGSFGAPFTISGSLRAALALAVDSQPRED